MALVIDVPLNTAIADLDQALRVLLKRELDRHGFEGVDIEFDAPSREWSGKLTAPTVDLFLYDLRRAAEGRSARRDGDERWRRASTASRPCALELTYAVTAWTKAVEDEHRLLSQVLPILLSLRDDPGRPTRRAPGERRSRPRPVETDRRPPARGEVRLLERGRRPVQGVRSTSSCG